MRSLHRTLIDFIAYATVRFIVAVVQVIPLDMGDHLCRNLARLLSGPLPVRRKAIQDALDRIFPEVDPIRKRELTVSMWHHLMLMVCEVAWAQRRLHRSNWREHANRR